MNKIILFDLDETIIEYGNKIDDEMISHILDAKKLGYDLGVVSERKLDKMMSLSRNFTFSHIFSECGSTYHTYNGNNLKQIYRKNIKSHKIFGQLNILIKVALNFLSTVEYELSGHLIDIRNGLIYISLIGLQANDLEKNNFIEQERKNKYIEKLLNILIIAAEENNILQDLFIGEGGRTGIVIYPKEWNKSQIIENLDKYENIIYIGDKYKENENDYEIMNHPKVKGIKVNNVNDTKIILQNIQNFI